MPSPPPEVSIVVPARNAAPTLEGTLESIVAQTFGSWEAIVIDDGSTDATASLAGRYARGDSRFSILPGPVRNLGSARNAGLGKAAGRFLLFLDADDTIEPDHLARLTEQLRLRSEADVVCCGWKFASANHTISVEPSADVARDPFEFLARWCIAPVHAVLVRARRVREAGGFDEQLCSCEDWDLWQRIARAGASFATVPEVLARYNLRPDSMSSATGVMLEAGLCIIAQAHGPDPRVRSPSPANRNGRPSWQLPDAQSNYAMWVAGRAIGIGQDAEPILRAEAVHYLPMSAWRALAQAFRIGLETGLLARDASASADAWIDALRRSVAFFQRLEALHDAVGLARALGTIVEAITHDVLESRTVSTGFVHSVAVEVLKPIEDVVAPPGATLLRAALEVDRAHLGIVELPVCDGCVRSYVLADAIAAEFAYPILGHFLARTLYPQLEFRETASASDDREKCITCFRGGSPIQTDLSRADCSGENLHNQVGWTIFLQELWGYPDWPASRFYQDALEPAASDDPSPGRLSVEVSRPLPSVVSRAAHVTVSVGATPFACFALPPEAGDVSADRLLATTTLLGGFELCRIAVREGIIGRAIDGSSLRARLAERASQPLPAKADMHVSDSVLTESEARRVLLHLGAPAAGAVLIGGRADYPLGFSASRRASLPTAAAPAVLEWAAAERLALASTPDGNGTPGWLGYAPDLLGRTCMRRDADESSRNTGTIAAVYDRTYFESLFRQQRNPWDYDNTFERVKYAQTLALVPRHKVKRALEIPCAEGDFTIDLADRVGQLVAADISEIAVGRAADRCRSATNVTFVRLDMIKDDLPGTFDLIVCSEVLYFMGDVATLAGVASKLASALNENGTLIMAHANMLIDEPDRPGFDWGMPFGSRTISQVFGAAPGLQLAKELDSGYYRITLLEKTANRRPAPETLSVEAGLPLPPHIAGMFRPGGEQRTLPVAATRTTTQLPILMYHSVAPDGPALFARYRVTPKQFESQLRFLRDSGYYSITLGRWRHAVETRRLPEGRAIVLTFDDGYLDFRDQAWPLLRKYGFGAIVFVVTEYVGRASEWEDGRGALPLLGWNDIRELHGNGIEFGAQSSRHRLLISMTPEEVTLDLLASRMTLARMLDAPAEALAYPNGAVNGAVRHLAGACGFTYGLSDRRGFARLGSPFLELPRIEICGEDDFESFVAKLSPAGR